MICSEWPQNFKFVILQRDEKLIKNPKLNRNIPTHIFLLIMLSNIIDSSVLPNTSDNLL